VRRTIDWDGDAVTIIDQTALPADYRVLSLHTVDELETPAPRHGLALPVGRIAAAT
jgi:methylthioribose-1-phosphate isomerase